MKFIGITGGVGAGKTAILNYLAKQPRTRVMLADEIAKELMLPGSLCFDKLKILFEKDNVWAEDGKFDSLKLAKVIFTDDAKRMALNDIVHPAVKQYCIDQYEEEKQKGELELLVFEAALLIEEEYDKVCQELWYIFTTVENRRIRLKANRGYSDEKIDGILKSQLSEGEYKRHCKVMIDNNHSIEETLQQVEKEVEKLRSR